ncbi:MAG: hypothetical protein M1820_003888 [Bogoriella megaspora]|nr:MAG: hypothetical protein M1820_003888 [Bogoriella megaspora]
MSQSKIARHYDRILKAWPKDALRPAEIQFRNLLQKRIERQAAGAVANDSSSNVSQKNTAFSDGAELRQINALYSLLDNRYSKQYPVSARLMQPNSDPTYYQRLAKEMEEAPKRTWFGAMINRWKGMVRFT